MQKRKQNHTLLIGWILILLMNSFSLSASGQTEDLEEENSSSLTVINDQFTSTYEMSPSRAVTMNQTETEKMLALGLEGSMIGTAYLDDAIWPEFAEAYNSIPVLSDKYPSMEILLNAEPDFVYAGFASAFQAKRNLPTREELQDMGINSYLCPTFAVNDKDPLLKWNIEMLYGELRDISLIFGVEERGEELISQINDRLSKAVEGVKQDTPPSVLWLDMLKEDEAFICGALGVPNAIIQLSGGSNVFEEIMNDWETISIETLLDQDPDLIVVIDAEWDPAEQKIERLINDPIFSGMRAVQEKSFVVIDFSASTPGIRLPVAVETLASALQQ